jgi:acetyltransferase
MGQFVVFRMDRFFNPKSVVVFGASRNPNKGGSQVTKNIKQYMQINHHQHFYLVHPKEKSLYGTTCYSRLTDIPYIQQNNRIDLAIVVIPVPAVMDVVRECVKANIRGILIESGNFADSPDDVKKYTKEALELIKGKDIRIVGPNSVGFYVPSINYCTPIKHHERLLEKRDRNVSIVAQSGLFITGFVEFYLDGAGLGQPFGVSHLAAIGNKSDVHESDFLEYLLNDPDTHAIGLYLEDIKDGRRFVNLLKKNKEVMKKPIVLLKSGKSEKGMQAIQSHTGSLAGNFAMIEAISKQFAVILVDSFEAFFNSLTILCQYPRIKGNNIGAISVSGAGCVLCSDFAEKYNLELPELSKSSKMQLKVIFPEWAPIHNPLDTWASVEKVGPFESFNIILKTFLESKQFDAIVVMTIGSEFATFDLDAFKEMKNKYEDIPIVAHYFGGESINKETIKGNKIQVPVIGDLDHIFMIYAQIVRISRIFNRN